jgi:subtilisin family serine protease
VINLSLGGPTESAAISAAVDYAVAQGVVVVAAAGNTGLGGAATWPAADPNVMAVASFDRSESISWFSTSGSYVDLAAPGSAILSTTAEGTWGHRSGTSMAAPHIAGVISLMQATRPLDTVEDIRTRLNGTARDAGAPGFDSSFGHGIVEPDRAVLD